MAQSKQETLAMVAIACSGLMWGLFWIPLRAIDNAGIQGAWATLLFYLVPMCILLPVCIWRWSSILNGGLALNLSGILSGTALVLYAGALIFTDVVHALLLYYLTPLWSTLLARLVLGDPITRLRMLVLVLGFSGMWVILGTDTNLPWPKNSGDWMGLAAGIIWAMAAVQMRVNQNSHGIDLTLVYFIWGSIAAFVLTFVPLDTEHVTPSWGSITKILPWFVPVAIILVIPPSLAVLWGASILNPGIVGILFMTEISIGTLTAAIWANEPFGLRELIGIALITTAGLLESIYAIVASKN